MHAFSSSPRGSDAAVSGKPNPRVAAALAVVILAHVAILALVATRRDAAPPVPIASPTIIAELLSPVAPPQPVAAPVESPPPPIPVPPKPVVKHHIVKQAPRPVPRTVAPSAITEPAPPEPTAPAAAVATPAPPAPSPPVAAPTIAISGPKNVQHISCSIVQPEYPAFSRRNNETGTALIHIVVDTRGKVESAVVKHSSGSERLDAAARGAALQSPCTPYQEGGQAIRAMTDVPFRFTLND